MPPSIHASSHAPHAPHDPNGEASCPCKRGSSGHSRDLMHNHLCHVVVLMIDALYQRCTFGMHAEGICSEHIVRINVLFQFAEPVILFLGIVILVPHRVQTGPSFWIALAGVRAPKNTPVFVTELAIFSACFLVISTLVIICQLCNAFLRFMKAVHNLTHSCLVTPAVRCCAIQRTPAIH